MAISVHDFVDVSVTAQRLGCTSNLGIAILPRNFSTAADFDQLIHESNAATVRSLLRSGGITETRLDSAEVRIPDIQENDFTWVGPILFFAAAEIAQNPEVVSVSLGVIANYLTDFFRGQTGSRRVKFDVVVEQTRTKRTTRIHYDGDVDGFKELSTAVMEVCRDGGTSQGVSEEAE